MKAINEVLHSKVFTLNEKLAFMDCIKANIVTYEMAIVLEFESMLKDVKAIDIS